MKKHKIFKKIISAVGILALIFFLYLFVGKAPKQDKIIWGVSFSQKQADLLSLSWKETYLAILDDLKVPALKISAYWDLVEPVNGEYDFEDLDFQIQEAEKRNIMTILAFGRKVPRWPECHIPEWAKGLDAKEQEEEVLELVEEITLRYKEYDIIWAWQIENEPFFNFGECPDITEDFLKQEIQLVKDLDERDRTIMISDSGSNRFWFKTAKLGDMVSISLYRKVWFNEFDSYVKYPFPSVFYWRKAQIVKKLFGKEVICGELQAEPWGAVLISDLPLEEQKETMDLEQFKNNIEFAKGTGLSQFYLWGGEWWYWMKEKHESPEIWEEAKLLFQEY